ncbi:hypothetical protein AYI68_g6441 [Smittium mucronatum]|uniref:Uncharacterized protein n=1 Tax=Smittium mucronatum TaxID=133383 RepID=A0A1R0GRI0_9FUNG|nr:hypothetical protein AYI68_g6441 [Smittium mucronatum]
MVFTNPSNDSINNDTKEKFAEYLTGINNKRSTPIFSTSRLSPQHDINFYKTNGDINNVSLENYIKNRSDSEEISNKINRLENVSLSEIDGLDLKESSDVEFNQLSPIKSNLSRSSIVLNENDLDELELKLPSNNESLSIKALDSAGFPNQNSNSEILFSQNMDSQKDSILDISKNISDGLDEIDYGIEMNEADNEFEKKTHLVGSNDRILTAQKNVFSENDSNLLNGKSNHLQSVNMTSENPSSLKNGPSVLDVADLDSEFGPFIFSRTEVNSNPMSEKSVEDIISNNDIIKPISIPANFNEDSTPFVASNLDIEMDDESFGLSGEGYNKIKDTRSKLAGILDLPIVYSSAKKSGDSYKVSEVRKTERKNLENSNTKLVDVGVGTTPLGFSSERKQNESILLKKNPSGTNTPTNKPKLNPSLPGSNKSINSKTKLENYSSPKKSEINKNIQNSSENFNKSQDISKTPKSIRYTRDMINNIFNNTTTPTKVCEDYKSDEDKSESNHKKASDFGIVSMAESLIKYTHQSLNEENHQQQSLILSNSNYQKKIQQNSFHSDTKKHKTNASSKLNGVIDNFNSLNSEDFKNKDQDFKSISQNGKNYLNDSSNKLLRSNLQFEVENKNLKSENSNISNKNTRKETSSETRGARDVESGNPYRINDSNQIEEIAVLLQSRLENGISSLLELDRNSLLSEFAALKDGLNKTQENFSFLKNEIDKINLKSMSLNSETLQNSSLNQENRHDNSKNDQRSIDQSNHFEKINDNQGFEKNPQVSNIDPNFSMQSSSGITNNSTMVANKVEQVLESYLYELNRVVNENKTNNYLLKTLSSDIKAQKSIEAFGKKKSDFKDSNYQSSLGNFEKISPNDSNPLISHRDNGNKYSSRIYSVPESYKSSSSHVVLNQHEYISKNTKSLHSLNTKLQSFNQVLNGSAAVIDNSLIFKNVENDVDYRDDNSHISENLKEGERQPGKGSGDPLKPDLNSEPEYLMSTFKVVHDSDPISFHEKLLLASVSPMKNICPVCFSGINIKRGNEISNSEDGKISGISKNSQDSNIFSREISPSKIPADEPTEPVETFNNHYGDGFFSLKYNSTDLDSNSHRESGFEKSVNDRGFIKSNRVSERFPSKKIIKDKTSNISNLQEKHSPYRVEEMQGKWQSWFRNSDPELQPIESSLIGFNYSINSISTKIHSRESSRSITFSRFQSSSTKILDDGFDSEIEEFNNLSLKHPKSENSINHLKENPKSLSRQDFITEKNNGTNIKNNSSKNKSEASRLVIKLMREELSNLHRKQTELNKRLESLNPSIYKENMARRELSRRIRRISGLIDIKSEEIAILSSLY